MTKSSVLQQLAEGGPEQRAVDAGEIDAVIDHARGNVILLPAARRALARAANHRRTAEVASANRLLAALPPGDYAKLLPGLEPLTLRFGEVLLESERSAAHVYFPIDCVVCLLARAEGREALGIDLVGREGMVASLAVVHATGTAMRMTTGRFDAAFAQCLPLQKALYAYTQSTLAMATQAVACVAFHDSEARLARWLLMTGDRMQSTEFTLTQDFLADMLGVRRSTINGVAGPLQRRGLIHYSRGRISLLDRKGLMEASCRCYSEPATPGSG